MILDEVPWLLGHEVAETAGPVECRHGIVVGWGGGYLVVLTPDGLLATFNPSNIRVVGRLWSAGEWCKQHGKPGP